MRRTGTMIVAAAIAGALVLSSTAAVAAAPSPARPSPVSWTALSMLNSAGAMGLAGEASEAGAPGAPQAPPTAAQADAHPGVPLPVIAVMLGTLAMGVYVLAKSHHGSFHITRPNSPA